MKFITSIAASAALAFGVVAVPSIASAEVLSSPLAMEKCGFNANQIRQGFYCVKTVELSATGETREIGSGGQGANSSVRCQDEVAETVTYSSYNHRGQWMEDRTVVEYGDTKWGSSYTC